MFVWICTLVTNYDPHFLKTTWPNCNKQFLKFLTKILLMAIMWNLIASQKSFVQLLSSGFQWLKCDIDKSFASFRQNNSNELNLRYRRFFTLSMKVSKTSAPSYPLSTLAQHFCARGNNCVGEISWRAQLYVRETVFSHL